MKNKIIIFFLLISIVTYGQQNQKKLKGSIDFGEGIILSTILNVQQKENNIIITSPKNADYRISGRTKGILGRILGKSPKKGILMTINSKLVNDSLIGDMKIPMFGKLKFKGVFKDEILNGKMIKDDTLVIGTLKGTKYTKSTIDYSYLYPKIIEITENNIFSKSVLQTKEWKKNTKKIKKLLNSIQDDMELFIGFSILGHKAPFSHYSIFIQKNENTDNAKIDESNESNEPSEPTVIFKEEDNNTAYIKIKDFVTSKNELATILPKIVKNNYQNLIIDLRNNGGGGIESAFELAKYIVDEEIVVGYFVTNKLQYSGFQLDLFKTLPVIKMQSTKAFVSSLKKGKGSKLVFRKHSNPIFLGKIYVLTNGNTASTCEPIVYQLKESKRATVIGENTMGAMLSATYFNIHDKYKLFLPIADFYTYDGVRLEGIGVKPNIETKSDKALDKALEIIKTTDIR